MGVYRFLTLFAVCVAGSVLRVDAQVYTFVPQGSNETIAYSINDSGAIAGYSSGSGFIRDPLGNIIVFDAPGGYVFPMQLSINASGTTVGTYMDANSVYHGFLRDPSGNLTIIDPLGSLGTYPTGINAGGTVVGYYEDANGGHGFIRDPSGNFTVFDPPGSRNTNPTNINAGGTITGSYYDNSSFLHHGFIRDPLGNFSSFDVSGTNISTFPLSINDSGTVAGDGLDMNDISHGFVRDPSGNITVFDGPPDGLFINVYGINASGAIAGYYADGIQIAHGYIRDPSGNITVFNAPDGSSIYAQGINASGAIVGDYGPFVGFVARVPNGIGISQSTTPNPIPSSVWQGAAAAGVSNVVAQVWGGLSKNTLANAQLTSAQSYGLKIGADVLLSYFSNRSPQYQVSQAFQAMGPAIDGLSVIAVDVEPCCGEFVPWKASTSYKAGAQIMDAASHIQKVTTAGTSGSVTPAWNNSGGTITDGTVAWHDTGNVVVSRAARIQYISKAVAYIQQQYPNLRVVIYTSNGTDKNWQTITGNCGSTGTNACPSLISLPLWDVEHQTFTAGDGTQHLGDGVAGLVPWTPWGATTWQSRSGNPYDWGSCTTAGLALEQNSDPEARPAATQCSPNSYFGLTAVELDYFDPALF